MNPDDSSYIINKYVGGIDLSLDEARKILDDFIRDYGDVLSFNDSDEIEEVETVLMPDQEGFEE